MENISTRRAAKLLGISASSLSRYLAAGKIPAPKAVQVGGMTIHLWTEREIERVRKMLPNVEDGRTTRHRKQARKDKKPTS